MADGAVDRAEAGGGDPAATGVAVHQADHRRGGEADRARLAGAGAVGLAGVGAAEFLHAAAGRRIRAGVHARCVQSRHQRRRRHPRRESFERRQPRADAACGEARPQAFRTIGVPGPAGAGAAAGLFPLDGDLAAVRAGAGDDHGDRAGRGPVPLCAAADRAARRGADPGGVGRVQVQPARLLDFAQPLARAPAARIPAADRRQRRQRQGTEAVRAGGLPIRPLRHAEPADSRGEHRAQHQTGAADRQPRGHFDRQLLCRLCLYRLAHPQWRVHRRRSGVPLGLVQRPQRLPAADPDRLHPDCRAEPLPRRPVQFLRDRADNPRPQGPAAVPGAAAAGNRVRMSGSAIRGRIAGRCGA